MDFTGCLFSSVLAVHSRRDKMLRALGRARLWEPAEGQQVLHKLNLRWGSLLLLSHKEQIAFMDLWH